MLVSRAIYQHLVTIDASNTVEIKRLGNMNILTVSFTHYGSSVWNESPRRKAYMWLVILGDLRWRYLALVLYSISNDGLSFSLETGDRVLQI